LKNIHELLTDLNLKGMNFASDFGN